MIEISLEHLQFDLNLRVHLYSRNTQIWLITISNRNTIVERRDYKVLSDSISNDSRSGLLSFKLNFSIFDLKIPEFLNSIFSNGFTTIFGPFITASISPGIYALVSGSKNKSWTWLIITRNLKMMRHLQYWIQQLCSMWIQLQHGL